MTTSDVIDADMDGGETNLFAGLDGGASTTRVRVVDRAGRLIGEGLAGPGSLKLSAEIAAANARAALGQALGESGWPASACRLVCGLAGVRQPEPCGHFLRQLGDLGPVELISDGYAALLGAHDGQAGAIVIAGTGSVALRLDRGGLVRQIGGWGPVGGDQGSGSWLGSQAVRAMLRGLDQQAAEGAPLSPLLQALKNELGRSHEAILAWLASADTPRFARLASIIQEFAEAGDPIAGRLLDRAAAETGRLIRLIGAGNDLPISLLGGLRGALEPRLEPALQERLVTPAADAMAGALLRARGEAPPESYAPEAS
jgi:glucosamine kinase